MLGKQAKKSNPWPRHRPRSLSKILIGCNERSSLPTRLSAIYEAHNYGRRYIDKNYKAVLTKMEVAGKIKGDPSHEERRKIKGETTCADDVEFTFPKRKGNGP